MKDPEGDFIVTLKYPRSPVTRSAQAVAGEMFTGLPVTFEASSLPPQKAKNQRAYFVFVAHRILMGVSGRFGAFSQMSAARAADSRLICWFPWFQPGAGSAENRLCWCLL